MKPDLSPTIIIIFGITGDLSKRKLLPALYYLLKDDLLHADTVVLGISRRDVSADELLREVELHVKENDNACDPVGIQKLRKALRMHTMNLDLDTDYMQLLIVLQNIEDKLGACMNRLYYLSIPPQTFESVVSRLGKHGHNSSCQHGAAAARLLIEKPFGYNLASARTLIELLSQYYGDEQIFRIDHYVAKETVQNILAFRLYNPIFSTIWNRRHISSITITAYEKIDIEGRAKFYDHIGALRDFVQNHLLQLAAITLMDLPDKLNSQEIHAKKLRLLQSVHRITEVEVSTASKRAQYCGYADEVGDSSTTTETFASVTLHIHNDRWQDVPIKLQTGKALSEKRTDIRIVFTEANTSENNQLVFRLQPNEGINLGLQAKQPGYINKVDKVDMDFDYEQKFVTSHGHPDAYERVIVDAAQGDQTLFASSAEVLAAWEIVNEVALSWSTNGEGLTKYQKGIDASKIAN